MADILALLREYNIANKEIVEKGDEVIFGEFAWPKDAKTNYIMWGTGKDGAKRDYYTLSCIVYLLKNVNLPHSKYVRQAATVGIPVVRLPDRRDLLNYLNGSIPTTDSIDRTVPVDISIRRAVSKGPSDTQNLRGEFDCASDAKRPRLSEDLRSRDIEEDANLDKVSTGLESSQGSALPSAISLDKIQSLRAKFRANQQITRPETPTVEELTILDNLDPTAVVTGDRSVTISSSIIGSSARARGINQGYNSRVIVGVDEKQIELTRNGDPKRVAILDSDMDSVRAITSRERRLKTRVNVLQSQGKKFYENVVLGILRNVVLKESANAAGGKRDAYSSAATRNLYKTPIAASGPQRQAQPAPALPYSRYDQERFAAGKEDTAGFRIDTMSSYHGKGLASMVVGSSALDPPTDGASVLNAMSGPVSNSCSGVSAGSMILPPATPSRDAPHGARTPLDPRGIGMNTPTGLTPDPYNSSRSLGGRAKVRPSRTPIIIVPAAPTSLITMLNAVDILQDLHFVSTDEKRSQGCKRENDLLIHRPKPSGRTVPYRVVDQPNRLQPEEWNRVVAVFVQGQAWQFKGWPIGSDPAVIFSLIKGFHIKFANMPLDANVAKWNVQVINLDRRRHLDKVSFQGLWDQLEKFISKNKPFLRW